MVERQWFVRNSYRRDDLIDLSLHLQDDLGSVGNMSSFSAKLLDLGIGVVKRECGRAIPPGDPQLIELVTQTGEVTTNHDQVGFVSSDRFNVRFKSRQLIGQLGCGSGVVRELVNCHQSVASPDREQHLGMRRAQRHNPEIDHL